MSDYTSSDAAPSVLFSDPYSRLINKRESGKFIDKSEHSVDRLRKARAIPYLVVGGCIRLRLRDVEKALERFEVKEVGRR
jgi:hypothetical protein